MGTVVRSVRKPHSAEAILKLVLRELKMTARYKKDQLTGEEHLELARATKSLCRAWLRSEAQEFCRDFLGWEEGRSLHECIQERSTSKQTRTAIQQQINRFFRKIKHLIREGITAATMGLLGPKPLSENDLHAIDRQAIIQEMYADRFRDEVMMAPPMFRPEKSTDVIVIAPPMTSDQFIARVELYGSSVWGASQEVARAAYRIDRIFDQEHRWVSPIENCPDCLAYQAQGWVSIGQLPALGSQSQCRANCACWFAYRLGDTGQEHVAGRGRFIDEEPA